jgi:hypothetical protein
MVSKKIWIAGLVVVVIATAMVFHFKNKPEYKHVFINETSEHNFDESIRMSIFAAYKKTGIQNAVIISDFNPVKTTIEVVAAEAFKDLNLGRANSGKAILYYFSPKNKSLKIEVGYALEGMLPDIMIRSLELAAKSFTYTDHYQDFWAELIITLNNQINDKNQRKNFSEYDFSNFKYLSGGAGLTSENYSKDWDYFKKEFINADEVARSTYKAQIDKQESVKIYLQSLKAGVSSGDLDVLTEESRFMRKTKITSSYQLYRNEKMYSKAGIDKMITVDKLTFVFFNRNNPVLPLVLRLENGVWRVHEPYSWSLFQRFEDSNDVYQKYNFSGMSKDFERYITGRFAMPVQVLNEPLSLDFLQNVKSDFSDLRTLLIKFYWIEKVSNELENWELRSLDGDNLRFTLDAYMNLGLFKQFLAAYKLLVELEPGNLYAKRNYEFYKKTLDYKENEWVLSR